MNKTIETNSQGWKLIKSTTRKDDWAIIRVIIEGERNEVASVGQEKHVKSVWKKRFAGK